MEQRVTKNHRKSSAAKSSRSIKARAAGRRIEEFMRKSRANGATAKNWRSRAETMLKRLDL